MGLHEITFSPDVVDWGGNTGTADDAESGTYYNPDNIDPNYVDPNTPSNGN